MSATLNDFTVNVDIWSLSVYVIIKYVCQFACWSSLVVFVKPALRLSLALSAIVIKLVKAVTHLQFLTVWWDS